MFFKELSMNVSLHSLLFSQVLGFYLLIMAIVMLARADYYRSLMVNLKECTLAILVGACFSLIIGIILVLTHNIWVWQPEVIITVVAWLILIKSILWLSIPETMMKWGSSWYKGWGYYATAIISGVLGIILLSHGIYLFLN